MSDKKFATFIEYIGGLILGYVSKEDVQKFKVVENKRERLIEIFVSATSHEAQDRILSSVSERVLPVLHDSVEVDILLVKPDSSVFQLVEEEFEHLEVFTYPRW
jgi:hypothetical protein